MAVQESPAEAQDDLLHDVENMKMDATTVLQVSDLPQESQPTCEFSGQDPPIHTKRNAGKSLTGKTAKQMGYSRQLPRLTQMCSLSHVASVVDIHNTGGPVSGRLVSGASSKTSPIHGFSFLLRAGNRLTYETGVPFGSFWEEEGEGREVSAVHIVSLMRIPFLYTPIICPVIKTLRCAHAPRTLKLRVPDVRIALVLADVVLPAHVVRQVLHRLAKRVAVAVPEAQHAREPHPFAVALDDKPVREHVGDLVERDAFVLSPRPAAARRPRNLLVDLPRPPGLERDHRAAGGARARRARVRVVERRVQRHPGASLQVLGVPAEQRAGVVVVGDERAAVPLAQQRRRGRYPPHGP